MLPTSAIGKRIPVRTAAHVPLCRDGRPRTVRDWCAGRRSAPRWFLRLLDDQLAAREHAIKEARRLLATYQQGAEPHHFCGIGASGGYTSIQMTLTTDLELRADRLDSFGSYF